MTRRGVRERGKWLGRDGQERMGKGRGKNGEPIMQEGEKINLTTCSIILTMKGSEGEGRKEGEKGK